MQTCEEFKNFIFKMLTPISEEFLNDPKAKAHIEKYYQDIGLPNAYDAIVCDGMEDVVRKVEDTIDCLDLDPDSDKPEFYEDAIVNHIASTTRASIRTALSTVLPTGVDEYQYPYGNRFGDLARYISEARLALNWFNKYCYETKS